jgi:hypothetical protein
MSEACPVPDSFVLERPMRPKQATGDYVESEGLLVPPRFADSEAVKYAVQHDVPVIARSEHPDEYAGPSGLAESYSLRLNPDGRVMGSGLYYSRQQLRDYAKAVGDECSSRYVAELSQSFWQWIPGVNITCFADDVVEGRYHIFGQSSWDDPSHIIIGAIVNQDGTVERQTLMTQTTPVFDTQLADIIKFYEAVRGLPRFNRQHCPIIEMQLGATDEQLYFLQYHRTRDARPNTERLNESDYDTRDGWLRADAVRGAYLGGKALDLSIWYARGDVRGIKLPEPGSAWFSYDWPLMDEYLSRHRITTVIPFSFHRQYHLIATDHGPRSQMFKPQLSFLLEHNPPEGLLTQAEDIAKTEGKDVRLKTEVASDGRIGFLRYSSELVLS